jgi:hypothetical protein
VRVLKGGEAAATDIRRVILPLPGHGVTLPQNDVGESFVSAHQIEVFE